MTECGTTKISIHNSQSEERKYHMEPIRAYNTNKHTALSERNCQWPCCDWFLSFASDWLRGWIELSGPVTEQTHTICKMSNIHVILVHYPAKKYWVMTPLSVKRSLMEVHLQHQILMKDLHRKVYSPYETDKRVLQADFSG